MNILVLNQDWFVDEYRALGHTVSTCGIGSNLDIVLPTPLVHLDNIIKDHLDGVRPDVVLILDNSAPIVVEGLAETDIPLVFYSVDTHHHGELHECLTHVVDYMFVAQRDYIKVLEQKASCPLEWLPLWPSIEEIETSEDKDYGAVFVGTLNKELNPDRVEFFEALSKEVDLLFKTGKWWEIFPKSEIIVNQTVKGDLNFRVFEAMICGSMLLTEDASNGLKDLFKPGEHLVTYKKGDVKDAAEKIRYYMDHTDEARKIAKAGREKILAEHTTKSRAARVLEVLKTVMRTECDKRFFSWMINFTALSTRLLKIDTNLSKRALLNALRTGEQALIRQEQLDQYMTFQFVYACCQYDIWFQARGGETLIAQAVDRFPEIDLLKLAHIRNLLNNGSPQEAQELAKSIGNLPLETIYTAAEKAVTELLYEGSNEINSVAKT